MASRQGQRHRRGRVGERIAKKALGGDLTCHTAPFDVVDFGTGVAYEVKTVSAMSKDTKVHIGVSSMKRKMEFAEKYGLEPVLVVVVIHGRNDYELYSGELRQHVRPIQLERII